MLHVSGRGEWADGDRAYAGRDHFVEGGGGVGKSFAVYHAFCLRFSASFSYVLFMLILFPFLLLLLLFLL